MSKPLAIYAGYFVRYPLGGHILAELNYIVGLRRLGYDVIFVEECGSAWAACYDPVRNEMTADPTHGITRLQEALARYAPGTRWCYADGQRYLGLSEQELHEACRKATVLISRAGVTWVNEFSDCKTRIYVDLDPGFTQFQMPPTPKSSCSGYASPYDFQFHFTFGERIGKPDCPIPTHGVNWRPTHQPVALELVKPRYTPEAQRFTTVMSWTAYGSADYRGIVYGQKSVEMLRLLDLPRKTGRIFEIALAGPDAPAEKLRASDWFVSSALEATRSVDAYLDFIARSRGEFSVAKEGYVKTRCGWFSDRTAVYLASGKPAIVQDTGFSEVLPCGEGLFAFRTEDDVVAAVVEINSDYAKHSRTARRIAEEYFDSDKVLEAVLRQCDLPVNR